MKKYNKYSMFAALLVSATLGLTGQIALAAEGGTVDLGSAGNFVILAKTGISTTGTTAVVGDIGVSPAAATYITGFALTLPAASAFSTSALVTGKVYAPSYADPTPANLTTAILDMQTAYTDAAGRASTVTELGAGNIGGLTLPAGVYKWGTGLTIPTDVTLSGSANDIWIFQVAQNLNISSGAKIILAGGAQANNIFWVVAGQTTIGTTAVVNGNILDQTAIVLNTGATINGRALAQSAVTLDASTVTLPTSAAIVAPIVTPAPVVTPASTPTVTSSGVGQTTSTQAQTSTASAAPSANLTALQARLVELQATLRTLKAAQAAQQGATASAFGQQVRAIAISLQEGSKGTGVTALQQFLIGEGKGPAAQALGKNGATTYFGPLTRAALAEFQAKVGITPALGNFGPITRAYISAHYQ